ncbi:MAG TPA: hypothetical protein VEV20_12785 [Burkholderiales bacterium]|nr:hypothetical protein [Burkholderiales bacterium]
MAIIDDATFRALAQADRLQRLPALNVAGRGARSLGYEASLIFGIPEGS